MKINVQFWLTIAIAFLSTNVANGQYWETDGNDVNSGEWYGAISSSTQPIQFRHQANGPQSNFQWWTNNGTLAERMRLTQQGWLGLNTSTPLCGYHQYLGDWLVQSNISATYPLSGTYSVPISGAGIRSFWLESRAAFRTGGVNGSDWDSGNIGSYSFASGFNNRASGHASIAMGAENEASGEFSVALGEENTASNTGAVALGDKCVASGHDAFAGGEESISSGNVSFAFGENCSAIGNHSIAMGNECEANTDAIAIGFLNSSDGNSSVTIGFANTASGEPSYAIGKANTASGSGSMAIGCFASATGTNSTVLGSGISITENLVNSIDQSLEIGFNSDFPTMLVTGGDGTAGSYGRVGIGTLTPASRLHIYNELAATQATQTIESVSTGAFTNQGLFVNASGGSGWNVCMEGTASGTLGVTALTGGRYNVSTGSKVWGIEANASNSSSVGTGNAVGVIGTATNTQTNRLTIGVYGKATNSACSNSRTIGVYGEASPAYGAPCTFNYPGYFVGSIVTTGGAISISDQSLKTGEVQINNGLEKVLQLLPYTYYYAEETADYLGLNDNLTAGFMAQQVQEVIPEAVKEVMAPLVHDDTFGLVSTDQTYLGLQYNALIPYLTAAIQEQQTQIEELKTSINECCGIELKSIQEENNGASTDVKLSASQPILFQNTPNPHKGTCVIRYFVPSLNQKAEVQFFDMYGQWLRTVPITSEGMGQLNIDATDLASGSYAYSLVIADKVIDTRVMIKE